MGRKESNQTNKQTKALMFNVVKMLLKGLVGVCALNNHGNYIVDHGKSWKNHGIVFLNICGNPVSRCNLQILSRVS